MAIFQDNPPQLLTPADFHGVGAARGGRIECDCGASAAVSATVPQLLTRADVDANYIRSGVAAGRLECDCGACADVSSVLQEGSHEARGRLRRAALHRQALEDGWELLFNPERDRGVALLDRQGGALLDYFGAPRRRPQVRRAFGDAGLAVAERMLESGLLEFTGQRVSLVPGRAQALVAWLHVTNQCNLRCDYCYVDKTPERMTPGVGMAALEAVFRSAQAHDFSAVHIKFAGGEATLNPDLVLALDRHGRERAQALGLQFQSAILSNGVRFPPRLLAACQQRGMRVAISLDGLGPAHDRQRRYLHGGGSSEQVRKTIERLVDHGIHPHINVTVTDRNTAELPVTVDYLLSKGLRFNVNFVRDSDCAADFEQMRLRDERIIAALHAVCECIEANLPDHTLLDVLLDRSDLAQPHQKTCGVGESYLVIDQRGRVAKCHMELAHPVTDMHADDPLQAVRSDRRGVQNPSVDEKEGCRDCSWRYRCTGGCPQMTYRATGRYDVKSPHCNIYQAIYPRLLRLEGLRLLKLARAQGHIL